jgi:hypothetical protein
VDRSFCDTLGQKLERCEENLAPCKQAYKDHSLAYDTATPLRAVHLHRTSHAQTDATVSEQRRVRFRVDAEIEVEVGAVLVRSRKTGLRAQRVA